MEFDKVIKNRRSVRKYSNQKVDKKKIEALIECARLFPSAANRQNWCFLLLENDMKNKVAEVMEKSLKKIDVEMDNSDATHPYSAASSVSDSIKIIKEAPVLILVFRKRNDDWHDGDYLSIGSAVEHICLKATDLKLGSLWIRDIIYTRDKIAAMLGYDNMELVVSIAIGYSKEHPYERKKKKLEDIMKWYT